MAVDLDGVNEAISEIQESGKSFTIDGMTYDAANLSDLIDLRDRLISEDQRSDGKRPTFRAFNISGMGY